MPWKPESSRCRTPPPPPAVRRRPASVRIDGERIVVERLVLVDGALAAVLAERDEAERPALVERALRIGLLALQDAATSMDTDVVRREFEKLVAQTTAVNEQAARAVERRLRANFADGDGRLPRTLERFLGDRGALRTFVNELFDETKRDSAIGRIGVMLGTYFDGDASQLAVLLDPTRLNSPMHQFRQEIDGGLQRVEERLVAIEAAAARARRARPLARPRAATSRTSSRGCSASWLAARATCSTGPGRRRALVEVQEGRLRADPRHAGARGCDVRVVIEAKDRPMSMRAMREELREARENRGAAVAVAVFTPAHAPSGRRAVHRGRRRRLLRHRPRGPGPGHLEAAIRLARLLALVARRARGRGRCRGDRDGADRDPRAARGRSRAQGAADVDLERDEGRLDAASTRCARTSWPASPRPRRRSESAG